MMQSQLNKDEYLLTQRAKSNSDIARSLRKFRRHYYNRSHIPLDILQYPDFLTEDLRNLFNIANRVIAYIEGDADMVVSAQQLELPFNTNN